MKLGVFDVLRRSLDNTLANWPLIGIRLGETIFFLVCTLVAVLVILAPILVSLGINIASMTTPDEVVEALFGLGTKWVLFVWIFLAVSVLLVVFVAIHSLIEAGSARVYVDAERIAGAGVEGVRGRFRVFSFDRFWAGARDGWWTVFWIYNIAWTIASALLLIPLLPTLGIMLMMQDANPGVAAGVGCLGLVATLLLFFVVAIVTTIWVNRAIAEWGVHRAGVGDALSSSWRAVRGDFVRLLLLAIAVFVIALAGSSFFSTFSIMATFGGASTDSSAALFFLLPIRFVASLLGWAFSAAIAGWFLASYTAVAVEPVDSRAA